MLPRVRCEAGNKRCCGRFSEISVQGLPNVEQVGGQVEMKRGAPISHRCDCRVTDAGRVHGFDCCFGRGQGGLPVLDLAGVALQGPPPPRNRFASDDLLWVMPAANCSACEPWELARRRAFRHDMAADANLSALDAHVLLYNSPAEGTPWPPGAGTVNKGGMDEPQDRQ